MGVAIYTDLLRNVDEGIADSFTSAAAGMSAYVMPVAWVMFGISMLVWAIMILDGKTSSPVKDWMMKGLTMLLILQAASSMYQTWVAGPLFQLPNDLTAAIAGGQGGATAMDALTSQLDQLMIGLAQGMVDAFASLNIGGGLILICCLIAIALAGALLQIACIFNMIYAKIGLALLLGVGPFFVMCLMWQQIRGYFFSWLNTVLYFVFLSVMATMIAVLFVRIASRLMTKLEEAFAGTMQSATTLSGNIAASLKAWMTGEPAVTAAVSAQPMLNIFSISFQIVLIFLPMFLVALELRTLVSSMTGGSGGSFGSGVANVANMAMRLKNASRPSGKGG